MIDGLSAALLASNAATWYLRFRSDGQGAKNDLVLLICVFALHYRSVLLSWGVNVVSQNWVSVVSSSAALGFVSCLYCIRKVSNWKGVRGGVLAAPVENGPAQFPEPLIFPCRTTHTRLFPKKHSFSYSYLYVGIPIGWQGSINNVLSADVEALTDASNDRDQRPRTDNRAWLSVEGRDYLNRGSAHLGLRGKLEEYLTSQARHFFALLECTVAHSCIGAESKGLSVRILSHSASLSSILFQPSFILVSLLSTVCVGSNDFRSQQHF